MTLDIDDTVNRMTMALKDISGADLPLAQGYSAAKARAVAHYADLIADAYAKGAIEESEMKRELQEIERMTRRYARNMKGLSGVGAERAARAALDVVFGAIRAGLSFAGAPLPAGLITRPL